MTLASRALQDQVLRELSLFEGCLEERMFSVHFHIPCDRINESLFIIYNIELKEAFNSSRVNILQPNTASQIEIEFTRDLIINLAELKFRAALYYNIISYLPSLVHFILSLLQSSQLIRRSEFLYPFFRIYSFLLLKRLNFVFQRQNIIL